MDRPGNPVGREDNTLKVLPSGAAWIYTHHTSPVWVPIQMGETGKGQEQIFWLCWSEQQQFKECVVFITVML